MSVEFYFLGFQSYSGEEYNLVELQTQKYILLNEGTNTLIRIWVILEKLNLVVTTNRGNKDFTGERKLEKNDTNKQTKTTGGVKVPSPKGLGFKSWTKLKQNIGLRERDNRMGRITGLSAKIAFTQRSLAPC